MNKQDKVKYVKKQKQTRQHKCHWTGCNKQVPPAQWGCKEHWFKLPKRFRDRVWQSYQPGQEKTLRVSEDYLTVAQDIQKWIEEKS